MGGLRDLLVLAVVASAVPGSTLVLGQLQKVQVAPPPSPVVQADRPQEKKQVKPAAKAKVAMKAMVLQPARVVAQPVGAAIQAQAVQYVQQFRPMFRASITSSVMPAA